MGTTHTQCQCRWQTLTMAYRIERENQREKSRTGTIHLCNSRLLSCNILATISPPRLSSHRNRFSWDLFSSMDRGAGARHSLCSRHTPTAYSAAHCSRPVMTNPARFFSPYHSRPGRTRRRRQPFSRHCRVCQNIPHSRTLRASVTHLTTPHRSPIIHQIESRINKVQRRGTVRIGNQHTQLSRGWDREKRPQTNRIPSFTRFERRQSSWSHTLYLTLVLIETQRSL